MRKGVLQVVGRVGSFPDGSGGTVVGRWGSPDQVADVTGRLCPNNGLLNDAPGALRCDEGARCLRAGPITGARLERASVRRPA